MVGDEPRKYTNGDTPLDELAREYLKAMLARERNRANDLVAEAIDHGASLMDIYLGVFQPVQYEIGRLWEIGSISVGHEHYCTNATQLIMAKLYSRLFSGVTGDRRLVAACCQGELHELGLRMLTDIFEMDGWDTHYLGASTPGESVVSTLADTRAHLLLVGATIHDRLASAKELIDLVRASASVGHIPILVGGYTFRTVPDLWKKVGADGTAPDARGALQLGAELVGKGESHGRGG